ncbi:hypothetical protein M8C21_022481 [Ambrosia artemisiifolia]|uniref:Uncharacterized protein n=1 Tax=Ambrosia artemisiifolia TaxID=4212 RepID=A0AAD5CZA2_AMBAR|nr:hypothetical protein M8C21_022481 [Ambrosia artemisiifolia]
MGTEEDPQKIKKRSAAAYDYDKDPRWSNYWSNVLMPPHMSSRSDVITHYKHKFYHRYIDPDFVVEPMTATQTARSSTPLSSPSSTSERRRNLDAGSATRASRASSTRNLAPLSWDRQTIQFSVNACVFVVTVLAILPLIPRSLSNRAYRLSFMGTLCSSIYSIYSVHGEVLGKPLCLGGIKPVNAWHTVFTSRDWNRIPFDYFSFIVAA